MSPQEWQPDSAEQWLRTIRESGEGRRLNLIEEFYSWSRPIIRRAAGALALNAKITERDGAADIELVVSETLLALVSDVIGGRRDPAEGHALYAYLLYRSRARFRQMIRAEAAALAPITQALHAVLSDLHLDRPHMVRAVHLVSQEVSYYGAFPDVIEALREADKMEQVLRERDDNWKVTPHPLLDPELVVAPGRDGPGRRERDGAGGEGVF